MHAGSPNASYAQMPRPPKGTGSQLSLQQLLSGISEHSVPAARQQAAMVSPTRMSQVWTASAGTEQQPIPIAAASTHGCFALTQHSLSF